MSRIKFTDLHLHSEYSLKDGMIRLADRDDPKHVKSDIILNAEYRDTGAITVTDHGNMYGHAILASLCKTYGFKHIPACEFYISPTSRFDKNVEKGGVRYRHICAWAKNKEGYANLCTLSKLSFTEGFYYQPRIDRELIDKYGDGIMWSDACVGGIVSGPIVSGREDIGYEWFKWFLDRFKDDFYIEFQRHYIPDEDSANEVKIAWANKHGVPIIATTDAHYYKREDKEAHETLLCIQYQDWLDNPLSSRFSGSGYHLMDDYELMQRHPIEYLNNTQLVVDKVDDGIIQFGNITPPEFIVPDWFKLKEGKHNV